MEASNTTCELCGDLTPGASLVEDPDQGWDALCLACFRLQQPPAPAPEPLWSRLTGRAGLGRARPAQDQEARR